MTAGLGEFVWHDLMTRDFDRSVDFYTALFPEWTIRHDKLDGGLLYSAIVAGGVEHGGIVPLGGDEQDTLPSHWIGYVSVPNCDAAVACFERHGGKCVVPPIDLPQIGRFAVAADPQGALIKPYEAVQPAAPPAERSNGQFIWNELLASDIEAVRGAYAEAFGWELGSFDMGPSGRYTLFRVAGRDVAGGMSMPPGSGGRPAWLPYLMATDIDQRADRAVDLGAHQYVSPRDIPTIGRFAVMGDPTGATFALFCPLMTR